MVEILDSPNFRSCGPDSILVVGSTVSWMDPLVAYLRDDYLLEN